LEDLDRYYLASLSGGRQVEPWADVRQAFDDALCSPPQQTTDHRTRVLLTALGLRRAA